MEQPSAKGDSFNGEQYELSVGEGRVCQFNGEEYVSNSEIGLKLLAGDQYRNGGDDLDNFFKVKSVCMIIYATWSLTKNELILLGQPEKPHDNICHLTAHQIAFVDCKIRSLLREEDSLPKSGPASEAVLAHYQDLVQTLEADEFRSDFVKMKKLSS